MHWDWRTLNHQARTSLFLTTYYPELTPMQDRNFELTVTESGDSVRPVTLGTIPGH